jgi:hypothetical protein
VHAAEPAGREHPDTGGVGECGGRRHRRGAVAAQADRGAEVAGRQLREPARAHAVQVGRGEPDPCDAVEDGDRGGHGAVGADGRLELVRRGPVLRRGQAVGEQRAFQRDHRAARGDGVGDLG